MLRIGTTLLICLMTYQAHAQDLLQLYTLAQNNDPTYLQRLAEYRARLESDDQALANLLPNLSIGANTQKNYQDISVSQNAFGLRSEDIEYNSHGYQLKLSQPIYIRERWLNLAQAGYVIKSAEASLSYAKQELMLNISERYFAYLAAQDSYTFAVAEEVALAHQLEQAQARFNAGMIAITDRHEAQAGYDRAVAQKIIAQNEIDDAREALREITGHYNETLDKLDGSIALVVPEPMEIDQWTETAIQQNFNVQALSYQADVAYQKVKVQTAGHFPQLSLTASHSYDSTSGRFGDAKTHQSAVGLELNLPLFTGGMVSSRIREAQQNYNLAVQSLEASRRSAQRMTREAYLGIISGISQVKALEQAVISSRSALDATEAGYNIGTRTAVDVVNAQRSASASDRDLSQARYNYILDTLLLKQQAGTLVADDIRLINTWLVTE